MHTTDAHRPRNVEWTRAAALLYGDWGTSKAYVIGLAFAAAGYASLPIIVAVCFLTALVGYNYSVVCRNFPDGGGVYSAARLQSRLLAAVGALLLIANFLVTAALSGWSAMSYFGVPQGVIAPITMVTVLVLGVVNYFGPKHSGSLSIAMAIPTVICVFAILAISVPHLTTAHLHWPEGGFGATWTKFVQVILALSGVEAIASMTGVMKLNPGSDPAHPIVTKTSSKALFVVALEVVLGTALLGWAVLSIDPSLSNDLVAHKEDMLRFLGDHNATLLAGPAMGQMFGWIVGIVFGVLLLSAVNTAIVAVIGVIYMMALDGEFPRQLTKLNRYGVPTVPLILSAVLPVLILAITQDFDALASLYAIGVVGAITVNLSSCTTNLSLNLHWFERIIMGLTSVILSGVWLTIAYTISHALFFAICVVGLGLAVRAYSHKLTGIKTLTVSREIADLVSPEAIERLRPHMVEGQRIMVSARGITPVLRFALDEARLRKATLCVLYVKELAVVYMSAAADKNVGRARWQDDPQAAAIMSLMLKLGQEVGVDVLPVYAVSTNPAGTILDLAATMGVDFLMLGASHRLSMSRLLKGNVVEEVARGLPEDIQLIIHS
ncbi:MAG: amino acid permease [Chthoniobacter sp.]|uniref:amino acid permease n=1 Tax=Chthoniobacter sp. TaxID=2510640 RepID=UPI0032A450BD